MSELIDKPCRGAVGVDIGHTRVSVVVLFYEPQSNNHGLKTYDRSARQEHKLVIEFDLEHTDFMNSVCAINPVGKKTILIGQNAYNTLRQSSSTSQVLRFMKLFIRAEGNLLPNNSVSTDLSSSLERAEALIQSELVRVERARKDLEHGGPPCNRSNFITRFFGSIWTTFVEPQVRQELKALRGDDFDAESFEMDVTVACPSFWRIEEAAQFAKAITANNKFFKSRNFLDEAHCSAIGVARASMQGCETGAFRTIVDLGGLTAVSTSLFSRIF